MSFKSILLVITFALITACSHKQEDKSSWVESEIARSFYDRSVASQSSGWILHPCAHISGTPFRKYHSFIIEDGVLYGRKSETGQKIEIKDKGPHNGKWESVEEFLTAKGANRCDGSAPPPPPNQGNNKPEEQKPVPQGKFNPPITKSIDLYYVGFWDKYESLKEAASHFQLPNERIDRHLAKRLMHIWLSTPHKQIRGFKDLLVKSCEGEETTDKESCVSPKRYSYEEARSKMYGFIDMRKGSNERELFDYYCQRWIPYSELTEKNAAEAELIDPEQIFRHIPNAKINVEHSWPQSKFIPKEDIVQKTDYHHIFPSDKEVNAIRANFEFAEVDPQTAKKMKCSDGKVGKAVSVRGAEADAKATYFEPPTAHKGDLARAMFYFSTRYNRGMSPIQEYYFRKWDRQDPVDQQEKERNEKIYNLIGVRNPFIDYPNLVNDFDRFCRVKMSNDQQSDGYDCK
ncbi:MAG: endonuclease [Oligoflexia bacterium]|nr:endonuclease [Oligoflexia bacterium]